MEEKDQTKFPKETPRVLKPQVPWEELYFYQKSDVVYQMAFVFCDRFIHLYKDRTRDQVIQAARSCKQNIVEGLADGVTSTEMQMKLLNVARSSLKELREDFEDYIKSRRLRFYGEPTNSSVIPDYYYDGDRTKYDIMLAYCRSHNKLAEYEPFFQHWSDEEMCNYGVTLCHMIDKMMMSFMEKLEQEFITEGGIRERMHKARTDYRKGLDERLRELEAEVPKLQHEIDSLQLQLADALDKNQKWQAAYEELKSRALSAYNRQQEEIISLKAQLEMAGRGK